MEYQPKDAFYDFESLTNLTTLSAYMPSNNKLFVGLSVQNDSVQANAPDLKPFFKNKQNAFAEIEARIRQVNKNHIFELNHKNNTPLIIEFLDIRALCRLMVDDWIQVSENGSQGTIFGFNSQHYDIPILAHIYDLSSGVNEHNDGIFQTHIVRNLSDQIIVDKVSPYKLFAFGSTGRDIFMKLQQSPQTIDIQILNEKLRNASLKRLSAQMGFQILTSNKLTDEAQTITNLDDVAELIAYNVSDVLNSKQLFELKSYQNPFETGSKMLARYQERFKGLYLKRDTTSAKFIEKVIAPSVEDKLVDDPKLELVFPMSDGYLINKNAITALQQLLSIYNQLPNNEQKISVENISRFDQQSEMTSLLKTILPIITQTKLATDFDYNRAIESILSDPKFRYIWPLFQYGNGQRNLYFKDNVLQIDLVEYFNFRFLDIYYKKYHDSMYHDAYIYLKTLNWHDVSDKRKRHEIVYSLPNALHSGANILMPKGKPVLTKISVGGAHGSFIDRASYETKLKDIQAENQALTTALTAIQKFYFDLAKALKHHDKSIAKNPHQPEVADPKILDLDIEDLAAILVRNTKKKPTAKSPVGGFSHNEPQDIINLVPSDYTTGTYKSAKFKKPKKLPNITKYTSTIDTKQAVHIDISSYYPTLIALLHVFSSKDEHGNQIDLYGELLNDRLKIKSSLPEDLSTWSDKDYYNQSIELLDKLLLNSASGAADADYDNNIVVGNKIMRMRLSGQIIITILAFLISEADGVPNSVNTDGIYSNDISLDEANQIIKSWAKTFNLSADGEIIDHFISKDSNNRLEIVYSEKAGKEIVASASGGTISHHKGTNADKNIALPPIIDKTLVEYLYQHKTPLDTFDEPWVWQYINDIRDQEFLKQHQLVTEAFSNSDMKERAEILQNARDSLSKTLTFFQHIVTSNPNKLRFITFEDDNGKPIYKSPINRVFFIDPNCIDEIPESPFKQNLHPTLMKLIVINKTVNENPEAVAIAKTTGLINRHDVQELLAQHGHISESAISNIDPEIIVTIQNQDLKYTNPDILNCLDIDAYVKIVKIQWENWSQKHLTNY